MKTKDTQKIILCILIGGFLFCDFAQIYLREWCFNDFWKVYNTYLKVGIHVVNVLLLSAFIDSLKTKIVGWLSVVMSLISNRLELSYFMFGVSLKLLFTILATGLFLYFVLRIYDERNQRKVA